MCISTHVYTYMYIYIYLYMYIYDISNIREEIILMNRYIYIYIYISLFICSVQVLPGSVKRFNKKVNGRLIRTPAGQTPLALMSARLVLVDADESRCSLGGLSVNHYHL